MITRKNFLYAGLILLGLFLLYSILVAFNLFETWDYKTTVFLQYIIPDFLSLPFSYFSVIGSAEITGLILLAIILLLLGFRKLYMVGFFIATGVIEIILKIVIHQPSPPHELLKTAHLFGFPSGGISHGFFAYPSGHSARFAFISLILIFAVWLSPKLKIETKKIVIALILILDFIMFISRIFLGEHWTTDVIGGILLGFGLAFVSGYFLFISKK